MTATARRPATRVQLGSIPLLEIEGLTLGYASPGREPVEVVRGASLSIAPGERIGIVGESGSGKSTLALAMLGFLRRGGIRAAGDVRMHGASLFDMPPAALRRLRGGRIALVPQSAGQAMTPTHRIGAQLAETIRLHRGIPSAQAVDEARVLLDAVRLPAPASIAARYPHELSGGQLQRVGIALALAGRPELLVLDEPTTGLDVTTQAAILDLLDEIADETGAAMVFVSHDLGVMARSARRLVVMYAGQIVEDAPLAEAFEAPRHPYTSGLLQSAPSMARRGLPAPMRGIAPAPGRRAAGCAFAPRCDLASAVCSEREPDLIAIAPSRRTRCINWSLTTAIPAGCDSALIEPPRADAGPSLLALTGIAVDYRQAIPLWRRVRNGPSRPPTVDDISLSCAPGETLALVGESGSGKSTIARTIAGALTPLAGEIRFDGRPLGVDVRARSVAERRRIQFIFQNPDSALNPRHTVEQILERPLHLFTGLGRAARRDRIEALLSEARLPVAYRARYPDQLSGGEKQRVAIARALAAEPDLLLCDEIVSALDVSVQAAILRLLAGLRDARGLAVLFVAHDLAVVRALADRVAVLYAGRLCEVGPVARVYAPPFHPYTAMLIAAAPSLTPGRRAPLAPVATGNATGVAGLGCPFAARCGSRIAGLCEREAPPWRTFAGGHAIRCHLPAAELPGIA